MAKAERQAAEKTAGSAGDTGPAKEEATGTAPHLASEAAAAAHLPEGGSPSAVAAETAHLPSSPTLALGDPDPTEAAGVRQQEAQEQALEARQVDVPAITGMPASEKSKAAEEPATPIAPTLRYHAQFTAIRLPLRQAAGISTREEASATSDTLPAAVAVTTSAASAKAPAGRSKTKAKPKAKKAVAKTAKTSETTPMKEAESNPSTAATLDTAESEQSAPATCPNAFDEKTSGGSTAKDVSDVLYSGQGAVLDVSGPEPSLDAAFTANVAVAKSEADPTGVVANPADLLVEEAAAIVAATDEASLQPLPTVPKGLSGKQASAARKALGKAKAGTFRPCVPGCRCCH